METSSQLFSTALILASCIVASKTTADGLNPRLRLTDHSVATTIMPVDASAAFECPDSMQPAKVDAVFQLDSHGSDLAPFLGGPGTTNRVVIRRSGQVEAETEKRDNVARFGKRYISAELASEVTDLKLRTILYVCELSGFPEFVGIVYTLSGTIGNFGVNKRSSIAANSDDLLSLTFRRERRSYPSYWVDAPPPSTVGVLNLNFLLQDLPFQLEGGTAQVLADLWVLTRIEITDEGAR
ncbi:MAG: hypothetical protein AAFX90_07140 [Pseudomonadota bacterium]